ncbi:hypothetical protein FZX15_10500 [Brucella suis bv. 1]|nr:hypothetical protein FZX15_10500 [Brucella suis bv. 1]
MPHPGAEPLMGSCTAFGCAGEAEAFPKCEVVSHSCWQCLWAGSYDWSNKFRRFRLLFSWAICLLEGGFPAVLERFLS